MLQTNQRIGWSLFLACLLLHLLLHPGHTTAQDDFAQFYAHQVKPVIQARCYPCHGAINQEGNLRLDTAASIRLGGDSGSVVDLDSAESSMLLERVLSKDPDERMPPDGDPLTRDETDRIAKWIRDGAHAPKDEAPQLDPRAHWAFQPLDSTSEEMTGGENPIDWFILERLKGRGLSLSAPADPTTLIRRLTLDLHGLPPTPVEIESFRSEFALAPEKATDRLTQRLLASPRYGERWAQHWLDIVRYADTDGFEVNTPRPNAWPYRDYVIKAFNDNKPYDEFVFEQLAGDTVNENAATGFLVAAPALLPGQIGKDDASKRLARQDALNEMVVGTSATFLGMTVGCARCHDHKFDPVSQRDYYAMQAFFAGVRFGERPLNAGTDLQRKSDSEAVAKKISELNVRLFRHEPLATLNPDPNPSEHSDSDGQTDEPDPAQRPPVFRIPVDPGGNVDRFEPTMARFIRFNIFSTNEDNRFEPCLDELQVFAAGAPAKNIGLATSGTLPTSSGNLMESGIHQLKHINDGKFGNSHSWISNQKGQGWVQLELTKATLIDHVQWGRDRKRKFKDRLPLEYRIDVSLNGSDWISVASSFDRAPEKASASELATLVSPPSDSVEKMKATLKDLLQKKGDLDKVPMVFAGAMKKPDITHVLNRGDPEQAGNEINPAIPALFGKLDSAPKDGPQRRVAFARWIADSKNPLTARVMVNRVWQYHFGQGIVATVSDFGLNGNQPSHSELLDWLAMDFIRNGWSVKHLHRVILSSKTYRQSSRIHEKALTIDSDNRLLWRFPIRRLEAEAIRDSILAVSGQLNFKMGGPGFNFFKSRGGLSGFPPLQKFGTEELRRMVYAHKVRMESAPVFGAFDCPDAGQPAPHRSQSTTAIQALNLFNSPFVIEQAGQFAALARLESGESIDRQVEFVFRRALGRSPTDHEKSASALAVRDQGLEVVCRVLFNCSEFLFLP